MAGFGRLLLNPNAPPFFPVDYLHLLQPLSPTDPFYANPPTHYFYLPTPTPTHVINVYSTPPPPPPPPVVVSVGVGNTVAPPPAATASQATRSKRDRKSRHWCKRGGDETQPLMRVDPHGRFTTVMIRNIPNQYTEMLKEFLDQHCNLANNIDRDRDQDHHRRSFSSAYDFLYLPIDFGTDVNKGFAFVNFTDPRAVWRFHQSCADQKWAHFRSSKRCDVTYAKLQGKEALEKHFEGMRLECAEKEYLPVLFSPARDGSGSAVTERTIGGRLSRGA